MTEQEEEIEKLRKIVTEKIENSPDDLGMANDVISRVFSESLTFGQNMSELCLFCYNRGYEEGVKSLKGA